MKDIFGSIVAFRNDKNVLSRAISNFLDTDLDTHLHIVDNSPDDSLRDVCAQKNVEYIFNGGNIGFGAGHNTAMRRAMGRSKYTLVMNPDVYFNRGNLEKLFYFMEGNLDVGLVAPKVLYPDGSIQRLCRLLPNPYDMLIKKLNFGILKPFLEPRIARNELRFSGYDKIMDVPYLSGCLMMIRTDILEKTGLFDERFFIHFEDADLTRRVRRSYRTMFYPDATVFHHYAGTNKDMKVFTHLVVSGIKYFNKWGWFFDEERRAVNKEVLDKVQLAAYLSRKD
jgi:GT2 family glycosyltransferase